MSQQRGVPEARVPTLRRVLEFLECCAGYDSSEDRRAAEVLEREVRAVLSEGEEYVEWKPDPPVCTHHTTGSGPRLPLRYGSWATVVCVNCGKWVTEIDHAKPYKRAIKWRDASELLIEIAIGRDE